MTEWPSDWDMLAPSVVGQHVERYKAVLASRKALIVVKGAEKLRRSEIQLANYVAFADGQNNGAGNMKGKNSDVGIDSLDGNTRCIDVWWVMHDGGLLMLLPHLLSLSPDWRSCTIRLFVVLTNPADNPLRLSRRATAYLESVGIKATVRTVDLGWSGDDGIYEQTLDFKSRLRLLEGMSALRSSNPTMTLAVHRSSALGNQHEVVADRGLPSHPKRTPLASLFEDEESKSNVPMVNTRSVKSDPMSTLSSEGVPLPTSKSSSAVRSGYEVCGKSFFKIPQRIRYAGPS